MNYLALFAESDFSSTLAGSIFLICFALLVGGLIIFAIVFWIKMLIHAITTDIKDKALWILILLVGQLLGAIAYYFVVAKTEPQQTKKSSKK